jgi:hypothetical protein
MPKLTWEIPIKTVSELNCAQHWTDKFKRHKSQQKFVKLALKADIGKVTLPCKVTVTRLAPNTLDTHDNLPASQKYVVDQIASLLRPGLAPGRADDTKDIIIAYAQRKQPNMGILIEIEYGQ